MYYVRAYATNEAGTAYGPEETYTSLQTVLPGSITAAQSICYNTIPAGLTELSTATLGTGSYSYQWQSAPDDATWSNVGTDATTFAPGASTANTYYRRQATSGDCGTANSTSILITVYADLTAGTIGTAQALCSGDTPATLTNVASPTGGTGGYTYQWQISTTDAVSGFTNIVGATSITYAPPSVLTVDTWYRRQETSIGCGNTVNSTAIKMTITAPLTSGEIGW